MKEGQLLGMPGAVHLVPSSFSYAMVTQKPANTNNPSPSPNKPGPLKALSTEVTVLHFEGLKNSQLKQAIRAHPADAIAHEVQAAVENVVHKPICIIAGQWSVSSKSKGNFIYTLAGEVPFAIIQTYERILVAPFPGTTQLCPSLGWTRLLAHGIPTMAEDIRGPEALLKEV